MIKKTILSVFIAAAFASGAVIPGSYAQAQQYDGRTTYRHGDWERHHHHHNYGGAIAGGVAAGLIGGLIGGAIANGGAYETAPPPPRCWYESRPVQNEYDDGYHYERLRVCD
ncbi:hypothetical protein PY650_07485 [Rhizobium calliandrae]|uniref:Transmembrane protein n=1 Tax=Rhizobium calliandrae TaxID=1312182 RepID=A0ABT7KAI5_9HYPH|nr:hypothetical protein [Rhizobium calliandrae]MDL2405506.1 hypothetical protein [Rhizobium calliandrae]